MLASWPFKVAMDGDAITRALFSVTKALMARTGEKCFQLPNKLDTLPSEVLPVTCVVIPVPETPVPVEVLVPVVPEELDVLRAFVLVVLRVFSIVRVLTESKLTPIPVEGLYCR